MRINTPGPGHSQPLSVVEVVHVQRQSPHAFQHRGLQQSLQDENPAVIPVVEVQRGPQLLTAPNVLHQAEEDDEEFLYPQLVVVPRHGVLQHSSSQGDRDLTQQMFLHLDLDLGLAEHGETELVADLDPAPAVQRICQLLSLATSQDSPGRNHSIQ